MDTLANLEKKINSELTTKIKNSKIKHNNIYLTIDAEGLLDVINFDIDGFLKIVDRKKEMVLVSGFNVYPNEIEDVGNRIGVIVVMAAESTDFECHRVVMGTNDVAQIGLK